MSGPGSLAASFVMTVPLVAVPMLAVFGLPSLGARHVEAETDPAVEFQAPPPPEPVVPRSVPKSITRDGAEAFGPASGSTPMASAPECPSDGFGVADRSQFDPTAAHRDLDGHSAANATASLPDAASPFEFATEPTGFAPAGGAAPIRTASLDGTAPAHRTAAVTSLDAAFARLNAMGIREMRVVPTDVAGEFQFSCAYRVSGNTTRRFEADGADALAAAQDVLGQVESWLATR